MSPLPERLCKLVRCNKCIEWFFWHKKEKTEYENRVKSFQSASGVLFFSSFLLGKILGALILTKQIYSEAGYSIPISFIEAYYIVAATYVGINQMDLWLENNNRRFRKGERILLFWPVLAIVSASVHFLSGGTHPFPEELKGVFVWICSLFLVSKMSSAFKLRRLREEHRGRKDEGNKDSNKAKADAPG